MSGRPQPYKSAVPRSSTTTSRSSTRAKADLAPHAKEFRSDGLARIDRSAEAGGQRFEAAGIAVSKSRNNRARGNAESAQAVQDRSFKTCLGGSRGIRVDRVVVAAQQIDQCGLGKSSDISGLRDRLAGKRRGFGGDMAEAAAAAVTSKKEHATDGRQQCARICVLQAFEDGEWRLCRHLCRQRL